jgi:hypothetical protein
MRDQSDPRVLAIVLCERGSDPAATLRALRAQVHGPSRTLVLREADAAAGGAFWFLGRAWDAKVDANGSEPDALGADLTSLDAVVVLRAGDEPRAKLAARVRDGVGLAAESRVRGNVGENRGAECRVIAGDLDLAPEAYPFEHGTRSTRAVIRTTRGVPLGDVFDPVLAGLGEIGLIWKTIHATGPGVLLDEALMSVRESKPEPADANLLKHLLSTLGGPSRSGLRCTPGCSRTGSTACTPRCVRSRSMPMSPCRKPRPPIPLSSTRSEWRTSWEARHSPALPGANWLEK